MYFEVRIHGSNDEYTLHGSQLQTQIHICIGCSVSHLKRSSLKGIISRRDVVLTDDLKDGQTWNFEFGARFSKNNGKNSIKLNGCEIWSESGITNYMPVVGDSSLACREPYVGIYISKGSNYDAQLIFNNLQW